jgi:hypothetical protein
VTKGTIFGVTALPLFKLTFLVVFSGQVEIRGLSFTESVDEKWIALFNNEKLIYKLKMNEITTPAYIIRISDQGNNEPGNTRTTEKKAVQEKEKRLDSELKRILSGFKNSNAADGKNPLAKTIKRLMSLDFNEIKELAPDLYKATPKSDGTIILRIVLNFKEADKVIGIPWGESMFLLLLMDEITTNSGLEEDQKISHLELISNQIKELSETSQSFDTVFDNRLYYFTRTEAILKSYSDITGPKLLEIHKLSKTGSNLNPDGKKYTWENIIIDMVLRGNSDSPLSDEQIIKVTPYIKKLMSDIQSESEREMIYHIGNEFIRNISPFLTEEQLRKRVKQNPFMVDVVENRWIKTREE